MYMDLIDRLGCCLFTSNSESELDKEKNFPSFFFLGLSSSVLGGVSGRRPDAGTLMLPFGFFFALINVPFTLGLGVGGPWILVISLIRYFRLGDWGEVGLERVNFGRISNIFLKRVKLNMGSNICKKLQRY